VSIPSRFNGPLDSGNGGYCSGLFAGLLEGLTEVNLRSPVPLDTPLEIERGDGALRVRDGETLVAEASEISELDVEVPDPVGIEDARLASRSYRGEKGGLFHRCFVCGRGRPDSMKVFAGPVEGRDLVATPWTPPDWSADAEGNVRPEIVWASLDCPTYFAQYAREEELAMSFLASLAARIDAPVRADEETLAVARALMVEPRRA
jgi:hypothetical protein